MPAAAAAAALLGALAACQGSAGTKTSDPPPAPPSAGTRPARLATGERAELVSHLPVLTATAREGKRVIYSQEVTVAPGQVLLAVAEFQVTNDLSSNVYVGSQVLLATRAGGVTGTPITEANGENVTPAMHHGQQTRSSTYQVSQADAGVRYVNVVAWAATARATPADHIAVDPGYGQLSLLLW